MQLSKPFSYDENSLFAQNFLHADLCLPQEMSSKPQESPQNFPTPHEYQKDVSNLASRVRFYQQHKKIWIVAYHLFLQKRRQCDLADSLNQKIKLLQVPLLQGRIGSEIPNSKMRRNPKIQIKTRQRDPGELLNLSKKSINVALHIALDHTDLKDLFSNISKQSTLKFIKKTNTIYKMKANMMMALSDLPPYFFNLASVSLLQTKLPHFQHAKVKKLIYLQLSYRIIIIMQQEKNHNRHVQWDQERLKETEKSRGTFQKINEPKTPYHQNSDSEEQQIQAEPKTEQELALQESLYKAKMNCNVNSHKKLNIAQLNAKLQQQLDSYQKGEEMMDEEQEERERRKQQFKMKRNQHYNQFKIIQQMNHQSWEEEED